MCTVTIEKEKTLYFCSLNLLNTDLNNAPGYQAAQFQYFCDFLKHRTAWNTCSNDYSYLTDLGQVNVLLMPVKPFIFLQYAHLQYALLMNQIMLSQDKKFFVYFVICRICATTRDIYSDKAYAKKNMK